MRSRRRSAPPPRKTQTVFDPTTVAEIAAGYFWDPASASGLGGAGFKIPEGNGHTSFDLVQATVASQPTALSENGAVQYRMRSAFDANPSVLATAATVQAGWTGATYLAGWFRLPNNGGVSVGNNTLMSHQPSAAGQRRIVLSTQTSGNAMLGTTSTDGTASVNQTFAPVFTTANWIYVEQLFDPSLTGNARLALLADFSAIAVTVGGAIPASLFDGNTKIGVACRVATASGNPDFVDWASFYYGNGIPSLANRKRLRNRHRPVAAAV